MVYYINNFKEHDDLINKRIELTTNIFKLVPNADVDITKDYIDGKWRLTIKVYEK